jgi:hypothetical protein
LIKKYKSGYRLLLNDEEAFKFALRKLLRSRKAEVGYQGRNGFHDKWDHNYAIYVEPKNLTSYNDLWLYLDQIERQLDKHGLNRPAARLDIEALRRYFLPPITD